MKELIDLENMLTRLTQLEYKHLHHMRDVASRLDQIDLKIEALQKQIYVIPGKGVAGLP